MARKNNRLLVIFLGVLILASAAVSAYSADDVQKYIPDMQTAEQGMTMWQIIKAGGEVMIVLALLSVAAMSLIIYYFIAFRQERLLPSELQQKVLGTIEEGDYGKAREICAGGADLFSATLSAALAKRGHDKFVMKEAIEDEGRRNIDALWQKLSYLADIAAISPMVGLLGTVLGMIQAFNVIAFQTGAVKPILLASGISKAMVTTAAGLIVAIPAMIFYSFFRGKVQDVSARLEIFSDEIFHLLSK